MEAEKQVKFFQNCVAAAFAERDQSIIEVGGVYLFLEVGIFNHVFVVAILFTNNF